MDSKKHVLAPCGSCFNSTKHEVLHSRTTTHEANLDDGPVVIGSMTYRMIECCGCESISLSEEGGYFGQFNKNYYPPRVSRRTPPWLTRLIPMIEELYGIVQEIYTALHADSRRLALMGARTVVDMILNDKVGTSGTFSDRLKKLESSGYVSRANCEVLLAVLEAGNAAAHRGFEPSTEDMARVMDIVENILQALYVLGEDGYHLKGVTPPRPE